MALVFNDKLARQVMQAAGMGVKAASIHLARRLKEQLSEPAPRVRLFDKNKGAFYYVAGWLRDKPRRDYKEGYQLKKRKAGALFSYDELVKVQYEYSYATPGAPPRKLSGRLRASVTWQETSPGSGTYRIGTNVDYGKRLEYEGHPWLGRTLQQVKPELEKIVGGAVNTTGQVMSEA